MKQPAHLTRPSTFRLLGLDPGFASFGWCAVEVSPGHESLLAAGLFETRKTAAKRGVLACEDNFERTREIARFLEDLLRCWSPVAVCFEAWSPVRNASAAAKVSFSYGALAAVLSGPGLPAVSPTPQRVKKALTGKISASKDEVQDAVCRFFSRRHDNCPACDVASKTSTTALKEFERSIPRSKRDHGYDSVAVVIASLPSEVVRTARQLVA